MVQRCVSLVVMCAELVAIMEHNAHQENWQSKRPKWINVRFPFFELKFSFFSKPMTKDFFLETLIDAF